MKVIAISGHHNSGKTTLIERVAKELKKRGYRVGYIKHDPKGHGITDKEGSDTYRLRELADKRCLFSPSEITLWESSPPDLRKFIEERFNDCDVVIMEGFKNIDGFPKVAVGEVHIKDEVLRVRGSEDFTSVVELIERMEENL